MKTLLRLGMAALLFAIGCGDTTVVDGTGGAGGGGGGVPEVPPACAVQAEDGGPYPITLRFTNTSSETVFLREDCQLAYEVRACADDYAAPLALSGACTVSCASLEPGCIQCGPCPLGGIEVTPGQSVEKEWDGRFFTFGTTSEGCSCNVPKIAPAAKYRVRISVYETQELAEMNQPGWESTADFDLPAASGVVDVELGPPLAP